MVFSIALGIWLSTRNTSFLHLYGRDAKPHANPDYTGSTVQRVSLLSVQQVALAVWPRAQRSAKLCCCLRVVVVVVVVPNSLAASSLALAGFSVSLIWEKSITKYDAASFNFTVSNIIGTPFVVGYYCY